MPTLTKEGFVRILKEFKTSFLMRLDGKYMEVIDEDALMTISKNV